MKRFWLILAAMLGLAVQAVPASADVVYTLNCSGSAANCSGANANFNFGTVTLSTPSAGNVHVVVQLAGTNRFSASNNTDSFYWNTSASGNQIISNLTSTFDSNGSQSNASSGLDAGSYFNTGSFDFFVERDNSGGTPQSLSFDVTRSGGLALADFANGNGSSGVFYFAAQIRTTASSTLFWVASNKAGVTVPEPATWMLFFAVMAGLTMLYRRRKLARAA